MCRRTGGGDVWPCLVFSIMGVKWVRFASTLFSRSVRWWHCAGGTKGRVETQKRRNGGDQGTKGRREDGGASGIRNGVRAANRGRRCRRVAAHGAPVHRAWRVIDGRGGAGRSGGVGSMTRHLRAARASIGLHGGRLRRSTMMKAPTPSNAATSTAKPIRPTAGMLPAALPGPGSSAVNVTPWSVTGTVGSSSVQV